MRKSVARGLPVPEGRPLHVGDYLEECYSGFKKCICCLIACICACFFVVGWAKRQMDTPEFQATWEPLAEYLDTVVTLLRELKDMGARVLHILNDHYNY